MTTTTMGHVRATSGTRLLPAAYGAVHAVVDATTVSVVLGASLLHVLDQTNAFHLVLGYDVLAFGSQAVIGLVTDRIRKPRAVAIAGLVLTVLSLIALPLHPLAAMLLAGSGNALFHVGAGALALTVEPGRATAAGIFVGPGAFGLALGMFVGRSGPFATWPFHLALVASLAILWWVPAPEKPYDALPDEPRIAGGWLVALLLLFSVTVRSFVGLAGSYACPKSVALGFSLGVAACTGKALGGLVADRVGWIRTGVGALLLSAPLIAFGGRVPGTLVAGMFFFQMTMPVTLAALAVQYARRPALVFGMASLALIVGAVPTFWGITRLYYSRGGFFALIILSALALYAGLQRLGEGAGYSSTFTERISPPTSSRKLRTIG